MLKPCLRRLLAVVLLATGAAIAEQEGDYHREERNIPIADRAPNQIDGLLFWLRSQTGVTVDADGAVQGWTDAAGSDLAFTALANAERPARLLPNAVGDHPAVSFAHARHHAGGLVSPPVKIAPAKGMTLIVLGRVTEPEYLGYLLGYGATYQTTGALAMWARGYTGERRALLQANAAGLSATGNLYGRGFSCFAVRFDPATGEQALSMDGFVVARAQRDEPLAAEFPFAVGVEARATWSVSGDILAAIAYNRALTDEELAAVQRSLTAEYGLNSGHPVSAMAPALPFAYYPSKNQMEVAIALSPELLAKAGDAAPTQVDVHVLDAATGERVATGVVPLDTQARGQAVFDVPDFPDGEYAVEYVIGQHTERSPKTFLRIHFPFEQTAHGETHDVYPPFLPVVVKGNAVEVVGRRYTVNEQGLFDSVISLDRELLAAPMRLVGETADGQPLTWRTGFFGDGVKGRASHPDEAVFATEASSAGLSLKGTLVIQEDGCAKVDLMVAPEKAPVSVQRLWLEIPLKDAETPLFHFIADNGMRFNYAGQTPRGGRIAWYREPWDHWVPIRWRVAEPGPDDGVIWTSADTRQHGNQNAWDHRPFVPYLWLGAEERGLAFFMENERGFATDYRTPLQQVIRDGDHVLIRVGIFQQPVTLDAPRTITFGLMASPGKPLEPGFRTRPFASGVGPVSCWGGWQCSSKYPDNRDWNIVDKIQEIRRRGEYTKEDQAWFETRYEEVKARWPKRQINGSSDWLWLTTHFARRAADRGASHSGIYFEEHATDPRLPEWQVFQDEWASAEFNRFRPKQANWGVFSPSYHDFVLYMANEWMSRGVSLYFDNTNPKRCYNERFGASLPHARRLADLRHQHLRPAPVLPARLQAAQPVEPARRRVSDRLHAAHHQHPDHPLQHLGHRHPRPRTARPHGESRGGARRSRDRGQVGRLPASVGA